MDIGRAIYLDNNATARPAPAVVEAVGQALVADWANPSSIHSAGQAVARKITAARQQVADLIGARADRIIFASGATEANEAVLRSHAEEGAALVTSAAEHPAVTGFFLRNFPDRVHFVPLDGEGRWRVDELERILGALDGPALIAFAWAHGETGVLQDVAGIRAAAERHGASCLVDGSQAVGRVPVGEDARSCDYLTFSGHKLHGPKGVGALVQSGEKDPIRLAVGGGQERGWRGGTENVPGIIGFGAACALRSGTLEEAVAHMARLRDGFEARVMAALPDIRVNGGGARRVPNTSNLCFPGADGMALVARLDMRGILCSQVSACSSASPDPSQTLLEMGLSRNDAFSSVRFAVSTDNAETELKTAAEAVIEEVRSLGDMTGMGPTA